MAIQTGSCPLTQRKLVDDFFIEHRTKVLDLAAYLDRMDRSVSKDAEDDFRVLALRRALNTLSEAEPGRVKRIQMLLSDQDTSLLDERDGQSAYGASKRNLQTGGEG
ncbi:hypothetical protein BH24DEI1_BH24DEI1_09810 [soil metagenome]